MRTFKRCLCLFLALLLLVNIPGMIPQAQADPFGIAAGTVALGAVGVVGALLNQLGFQPGVSSSDFDSVVSSTVEHLKTLGSVSADGLITVLRISQGTADADDVAGLAFDLINSSVSFLDSIGIFERSSSAQNVTSYRPTVGSTDYYVTGNASVLEYLVGPNGGFAHYLFFYSFEPFTIKRNTYGQTVSCANGLYYYSEQLTWYSLSSCPSLPIYSYKDALLSKLSAFSEVVDVSSVPSNYSDVSTAYPTWVSQGVTTDDEVTYLPLIQIIIPEETVPGTDPTDPTDPTESTDPSLPAVLPDDPALPAETVTPGFLSTLFTNLQDSLLPQINLIVGILTTGFVNIQEAFQSLLPSLELISGTLTQGFIDIKSWIDNLLETQVQYLISLRDFLRTLVTDLFPQWFLDFKNFVISLPTLISDAVSVALDKILIPLGEWFLSLPNIIYDAILDSRPPVNMVFP